MSAEDIRSDLRTGWHNHPIEEVCLRIIDFLERLPATQVRMLTYNSLLHASGKSKFDQELLAAIAVLSGTRVSALHPKLLYIDEEENETEIEADYLAEARLSGEFIDPNTGSPVNDYENRIIPFFVPSEKFAISHE